MRPVPSLRGDDAAPVVKPVPLDRHACAGRADRPHMDDAMRPHRGDPPELAILRQWAARSNRTGAGSQGEAISPASVPQLTNRPESKSKCGVQAG